MQKLVKITTRHYEQQLVWLQKKGMEVYGNQFKIVEEDKFLICRMLCYFLQDEKPAEKLNINFNKGILITGPVGSGKTSIMNLMRFFLPIQNRYNIKSCRDVSFDFIKDGYETIHRYSRHSFSNHNPITWCFDDLGTENNLKYFGNECNVMAEVLLSRYDLFVSRKLLTHVTTNLSASEIEEQYGNRIRSRLREMMNLISFEKTTIDKRK